MKISFVRIYGFGIVVFSDLPVSLQDRSADIQAWVDEHYQLVPVGHGACLRIDHEYSSIVLHLMSSVISQVLK